MHRKEQIRGNVKRLLAELPKAVELEAATKTRTTEEIIAAIEAGIRIVGENYIQEAERAFKVVGRVVKWHFIGHLQRNKVKNAVELFDLIETIDSFSIAEEVNRVSSKIGKIMPILIEVNSGREPQKFGAFPEDVEELVVKISALASVKIVGLMTMGPYEEEIEKLRLYFRATKEIFERIKKSGIPSVDMRYLSMGMSDSYIIAIEEGANIVRVGTGIFGPRGRV
uniref:Pyridoxal phosphate homeostasis protein n=1 Tax=Candidatus Methanophaga sp. ANME-1 ERB7 TaxID=2759913 RepID=A0A7G9Z2U4_9EURY|nr:pyridoxal phosphate homeostasis protein [Methanosarcinales archaeon ANME-1 ERB7]